ncbi:MAG: PTS galactitol transporter subunit IIC [Oscillospiraceae bacterium]|nr:PTS galactitol transporter subunit IIC [Oscillospiraceae bacterium]
MDILMDIVQTLLGMGAVTLLPLFICILGLVFRMKFGAALKSGLFVGIGFQGLVLAIGLLMATIAPVIAHYEGMGGGFTTMDVGWAAVGAASWSVPFAAIAVPLIFLCNLILLRLRLTKVLNVDIWNFIHFLIPGALAYALFDSVILGVVVTVGLSVVNLFLSQAIAPKWQAHFGLEGTTCSTLSFVTMSWPFAIVINKIIDFIPGLNKVDIDAEKLTSKLGAFGTPAVMGLVVGIILGAISVQPIPGIIVMGMGFAAVLVLIPRMVAIMMEGLTPIGQAASAYVKKRMGEQAELIIGMDVALGLGDPACVMVTALSIPLVILFAFIIPGMSYFPLGMLTLVVYCTVMPVMVAKGNFIRSFIITAITLFFITWSANIFAPEATQMMAATGVEVDGMVTDGFWGLNLPNVIISAIYRLFGG